MLEAIYKWTSSGSTGTPQPGGTSSRTGSSAVFLPFPPLESALYCENSTIATTNSFQFQTAQASTGPWNADASTACAGDGNGKGQAVLRVTGPYRWMRPVLKTASTGVYTLRLYAVR